MMHGKYIAILFLLLLGSYTHAEVAPEAASDITAVKTAESTGWMAVTANHYASNAAAEILQQGGSAVDAAIAAQLVLGLTEPQSSGIGGGAFMLHYDKQNQSLQSFDGRETAPQAISSQHFLIDGESMGFFDAVVGGHAVGTPGVLHMLEQAHQQHGILPWKDLFQPAIKLAKQGFIVSSRLHSLLISVSQHPATMQQEAFTRYFFPKGKPVAIGSRLKNRAYAKSLQGIAKQGTKAFYQGKLAKAMVKAVQENTVRKGLLKIEDLAQYQSLQTDALCAEIQAYRLCGTPPPSSGPLAVMQIVGILNYLPSQHDVDSESPVFYQRFNEALQLAMADRNRYIADPAFVAMPIARLLQPSYLEQRAALIPNKKASSTPAKAGVFSDFEEKSTKGIELEQPSTTHLSIIDSKGNIVSMTSSIEMAFGSRILVGGFLLNNQLTDFSFRDKNQASGESIANRIQANKRPRSSMAPMMVFYEEKPVLAIGSPGGSRIIAYVAKVLAQSLYGSLRVQDAVASPHSSYFRQTVELEPSGKAQAEALQKMGYKTKIVEQTSGLHILDLRGDKVLGIADGRREGSIRHGEEGL